MTIINIVGNVWNTINDFILLIMYIIFMALFFVVQYYLIKGYKFLIVSTYHFIVKIYKLYEFLKKNNYDYKSLKDYKNEE